LSVVVTVWGVFYRQMMSAVVNWEECVDPVK
jgi:hypothetical protein